MVNGGLRQGDGKAGVVELAVVVAHAGAQFVVFDAGEAFACPGLREVAGFADAEFAGEEVVDGKTVL